jgi:transposase
VAARRRTAYGPVRLAGLVPHPPSTIGKVLRRHGCSRLPRPGAAAARCARRYERERPGELLHVDTKQLGRFWEPGKRVLGVEAGRPHRNRRIGWQHLHVAIDVECPRFRGQLSAGLSGPAERLSGHARKRKYRKPYPPEFRREAVALYARTDRTLGEIAGDLGVSRESLRLWVQQAQIERGERDGLTGDEREELRELRRRVLLLEQEREILKKAAAFFVKESETR